MIMTYRIFLFSCLVGLLAACSASGGSELAGGSGGSAATGSGSGSGNGSGSGTQAGAGSGSSTGSGNSSGAGAADAGMDVFQPPLDSYSITFPPTPVPSGWEGTQCVVKRLNNPTQIRVNQIHNQLGPASHHLIVYRTNDPNEQPIPFACQPFVNTLNPSQGGPLMITQKADELLTMPPGVAVTLQPGQMIRLEMHYINASPAPVDVTATTTFVPISDSDYQYEADFLFVGSPDISIPAFGTATLGPSFFRIPPNLATASFFGATGHTHQWGVNAWLATAPGPFGPDTPIYDIPNWNWHEPETVYYDPPIQVPANGGFHFSCTWNNLSPNLVTFGESANQEMCFFWTYYYPSVGPFVCLHTDAVPGGADFCCPGSPLCATFFP
jgi:hypothetical protein